MLRRNLRVSILSLDCSINEVVCVDHFFDECFSFFHAMDVMTVLSAAQVFKSTCVAEAVYAFEFTCVLQFWPPKSVHVECVLHT